MARLFLLALSLVFASGAVAREKVDLLTSIKPLQLIAAAVQDGIDEPAVLLPPGASAHHYALRPSDVRQLQAADLFYWIGPDMEVFLKPLVAGRRGTSQQIQTLPGLTQRHFGEAHAPHDQHDHDDHDDEHDHDHAHRLGSLDTHLWLLPANALVIAEKMAGDLAALDPTNAQRYQANLAAFRQRLAALDQRLQARLARVGDQPFFVFHEAYDYFEAAYGLRHAGVFSAGGEAQPGARHVAQMRQRLQQAGPSCVFYEPPARPRLAATLTRGLPVQLAELDALGGGITADAQGYERLLETLGGTLAECLEGL
ncbi:zinc ABC transporter substrate-binding protein [Stutzerimonas nitrititolerans]|uniref:zinc ABC transporter substrate-binding protein n=1 Tax=Stutzerimonas nitrititolerans TaxID=2482751 RepID=UPI002897039E|nr:zinc ABC transporter substrate-binding protein [Stutzerimonas nitrititolerans]